MGPVLPAAAARAWRRTTVPTSSRWTPPSCRSTSPVGRSDRSTTTTRTRPRSPTPSCRRPSTPTKWDGVALRRADELHHAAAVLEQGPLRGGRARPRDAAGDVGRVRRRRRGAHRVRRRPVRPGDRRQQHGADVADPAVGQRRRCGLRRRHDVAARRSGDDRGARLLGRPRPRRRDLADRARRCRRRQPVPDRAGGDGDRRAMDDHRVHRGRPRLRRRAAAGRPGRAGDARHERRLRHQRAVRRRHRRGGRRSSSSSGTAPSRRSRGRSARASRPTAPTSPADALQENPYTVDFGAHSRHRQVLLDQRAGLHRGRHRHLRADAAALPQR